MEEAEEQYKLALEADSNDADIHHGYGFLLTETGHGEKQKNSIRLQLN